MGNNMFAYAKNNPVLYQDSAGTAVETVWDIVSLSASIVDVAMNPTDPWAWAGLVGDIADVLIPCVGGIGELTKGLSSINRTRKMVNSACDVADTTGDILKVSSSPVVIGESMDRVHSFSKTVNADYFHPTPGLSDADTLLENKQWLEKAMSQNRTIYDIGIDPQKKTRSIFYQMEYEISKDYSRIIRVNWP